MSTALEGTLFAAFNAAELGEQTMKPKEKKWGHQVAVRFTRDDLFKLDSLVAAAARAGGHRSPSGMYLQPSRSSVLIDLVRAAGKPSTNQLELPDRRQVDLEEAIERSKLAGDVDQLEASSKRLERTSRPKKKAPHGAPPKRRAAPLTPKRKAQIAAAHKRFAAKKRRAGWR